MRHLDQVVAQFLFGWTQLGRDRNGCIVGLDPRFPNAYPCHIVPEYSASISLALAVLDKFCPNGAWRIAKWDNGDFLVGVHMPPYGDNFSNYKCRLPEAICRHVMRMMGVTWETPGGGA